MLTKVCFCIMTQMLPPKKFNRFEVTAIVSATIKNKRNVKMFIYVESRSLKKVERMDMEKQVCLFFWWYV